MEAKELRVTNLILNDGIANAVIFIGYDSVELITPQGNTITARLDLIQPIQLTEEWLIKFGFNGNCVGALIKTCIDREVNGYITQLELTGNNISEWNANIVRINIDSTLGNVFQVVTLPNLKYVHQLQNIYFTLSGEELTYE